MRANITFFRASYWSVFTANTALNVTFTDAAEVLSVQIIWGGEHIYLNSMSITNHYEENIL
jgi:hypothetical protein